MAITKGDVHLWRQLKDQGILPEAVSLMEIGQANWYGDINIDSAMGISLPGIPPPSDPFVQARAFYRWLFGKNLCIWAVDFDGPNAQRLDLNYSLGNHRECYYNVVVNTGTTEHVFNQAQVFQTVHDACFYDGGIMFHSAPVSGWQDHGFYTYSPCLFRDLARENKYQFLGGCFSEFPSGQIAETDQNLNPPVFEGDGMLHVAFRKTSTDPFRVPIQGRYRKGG